MNNYERIKDMTIEEMAIMLADEIPHGDCYGCDLCPGYPSTYECKDRWLSWLERECYAPLSDHPLSNGVIVPPCKAGDTVYRVVTMGTGVTFKKVGYNTYREKEQTIKHFIRCVTVTKNNFFDVLENFGKTVFLTREEAEQALKERKKK